MELQEILSVALGTLIVIVIAHFAVFWVVRTMYPPPTSVVYMPAPAAAAAPVISSTPIETFTSPPMTDQQNVTVPTYAAPVPVEAPREEKRAGPPPPEDTSIRGNSGVAAPNA